MFVKLTLASLEAFIALLTSFGNPAIIPMDVDAYMAKTHQMEQIEEIRTIPDFDRLYALWEGQFTGETDQVTFEQELAALKASLRA